MIDRTIAHVVRELNEHLRTRWLDTSGSRVVGGRFHDQNGAPHIGVQNRIVVQMVNIEESGAPRRIEPRGGASAMPLGVSILFAANFEDYPTALQAVWDVIDFFHQRPVLHIDTGIRVSFTLLPLSFEEQCNLWSTLRESYMPSVVFKAAISGTTA